MGKVAGGSVGVGRRPWEMPTGGKPQDEVVERELAQADLRASEQAGWKQAGLGSASDPALDMWEMIREGRKPPGDPQEEWLIGKGSREEVAKKLAVGAAIMLATRGRGAGFAQGLKEIPPLQLAAMLPMTASVLAGALNAATSDPHVAEYVNRLRRLVPEHLGGLP